MRLTWPLTGRSQEMHVIGEAISDPESSGIVICGAAGVGKSRIAREALSALASKGYATRWAVGTSSARELPLGALASWVGPTVGDSVQVVRDVIGSLTARTPGARMLVGIDDAHLLDDLSSFVVHQIVQRSAAKLLLTVRDGEPIPTGLQQVWTGAQFDRLDLQPLSQEEVTTLVSATLGGCLEPEAAHRLWKLTRGNALYLRNIVEQEVSDGRLALHHDYWRWIGDPIVPASLADVIESRIGNLPPSVVDVIDALAVGEPIDLESLIAIADPAAVEDADIRGLITLDHTGRALEVRVAHPLYGEVRRKRAAPTRLRRLRGLVAAELAKQDSSDDMRMVVRRAALSIDSDRKPEPELLVKAAQGAAWLADLALADRLSKAAIAAGAGPTASIIRARALTWLGQGQAADAVLADIDATNFSPDEHARLAFLRSSNMLWALSDPTGAKALIDNASRTVPTDSRSCLDAFLAIYWAAMGKPERARQSADSLDVEKLPGIVGAEAAWAITHACGEAGCTSEALAAADAGYAVTSRHFEAAQMGFAVADAHLSALMLSGRIDEALATAERMYEQAADLPGGAQLLGRGLAGRAALAGGRLDTACSLLDPVVEVLFSAETSGGFYGFGYRYQHPRTIALAMLGRTRNAAAALATLDERDFPSWRYLEYEHELAHAWVAASQGAVSEAITILLSAAKTAKTSRRFAAEVMCLQTATQLGDRSCAPRLRELAAIVEGPRTGLAARFATALEAGDGAELAAVAEEFERMGDLVAAVDAAAHAAIAYRRHGLHGSALGCSTRAEALAEQCGASTPALRQASERLPLTDREREIVMLLGEGLASPAIAERLTLSARTVEGHIYRAMAKTGTSNRGELAALLPRHKHRSH